MGQSLTEIAQTLKDANKKVQLIYAFNGTGKTRLSREFKELIAPKEADAEEQEESGIKILYYNAFTEDLFFWDNDLDTDVNRKMIIRPNGFTNLALSFLRDQGQDGNIVSNFQRYTNQSITPKFSQDFSEVTFSMQRGGDDSIENIKISRGEESNFIWCVFYSLLEQVLEALNITKEARDKAKTAAKIAEIAVETSKTKEKAAKAAKAKAKVAKAKAEAKVAKAEAKVAKAEAEAAKAEVQSLDSGFDNLEYVFIDDPVSSLDDTHLIELAVNIAELIKSSTWNSEEKSGLRFIITTHNPLFYNILFNEFDNSDKRYNFKVKHSMKRRLEKLDDGTFLLVESKDSPFSYHLILLSELEKVAQSGDIQKYHFNFLRNVLEKTATFLGYSQWRDLLPKDSQEAYFNRIINFSSHSKHHGEETSIIEENDKKVLKYLVEEVIISTYHFKSSINNHVEEQNDTI